MLTRSSNEPYRRRQTLNESLATDDYAPSVTTSSITDDSSHASSDEDQQQQYPLLHVASEKRDKRPSLARTLLHIANPARFKTRSSLPWGHKPHPVVGASCFLFLLPIPFLWQCFPLTAVLLAAVTVTSFLSDHIYTGLDSWAHSMDRALAPCVFGSAFHTVYTSSGIWWACSSLLAVACHIHAHAAAKANDYNTFVVWHSMWHVVGVGILVICFSVNDTLTCT